MDKLCLVTTLRAPLHETIRYVHYHLNIGVDNLLLFFDDPHDPAIPYLNEYRQVKCVKCNEEHWRRVAKSRHGSLEDKLKINASAGLEIARESGYDWIIHIDSDELLYSKEILGTILSKMKKNVVRFAIREAVPDQEDYTDVFSEVTLFKKPASRLKLMVAMGLGCRKAFFRGEYFRGHLASKTAVRVKSNITRMGIHRPESAEGTVSIENTDRIQLLHFDCCGLAAWKTKWTRRLGETALATKMRKNRRRQGEVFARASHQGGDQVLLDLYRRLYFIPQREKRILTRLHMLTSIQIDRKLFDKPRNIAS